MGPTVGAIPLTPPPDRSRLSRRAGVCRPRPTARTADSARADRTVGSVNVRTISSHRIIAGVLLVAAAALLSGCSADSISRAPGPFDEPPTIGSPFDGNTDTGGVENMDPGISVPMDDEGMEVANVAPMAEPVPIPTVNISEALEDDSQA